MFLANDNVLPRFRDLVTDARQVDLASAWATEGPALTALQHADACRLRAIVGLTGNATTPGALDALDEIGDLRLADGVRLFHPKVYVFELLGGNRIAWVGSANFTGMGFGGRVGNEEAILETRSPQATRQIAEWFERRWQEAGPLDELQLAKYRQRYRPPERGWLDERPKASNGPEPEGRRLTEGTRTRHAFFVEIVETLLREKSAKTTELNLRVEANWPELCGPERIMQGKGPGLKWKHEVRQAQDVLRKRGRITRDGSTGEWRVIGAAPTDEAPSA